MIDFATLGAAAMVAKSIPGSAANRAEAAAEAAEEAAAEAATHNYAISVSGHKLVIEPPTGGD